MELAETGYGAVYGKKDSRNARKRCSTPHSPIAMIIATAEVVRNRLVEKTREEGIAQRWICDK